MMCYLVLLLPVIALGVFWLLPTGLAVPTYVLMLALSGLLFWLAVRAANRGGLSGPDRLIGLDAHVVCEATPASRGRYLVRAQGELWTARCVDALQPGETVSIAALNGVGLVVERREDIFPEDDSRGVESGGSAENANERHCHQHRSGNTADRRH